MGAYVLLLMYEEDNMEKKFDQARYIDEYNKEHYVDFRIRLKKEDDKELKELLAKYNLSKPDFVRKSIHLLKKGEFEMNRNDVKKFMKKYEVKEKDNFHEEFALGAYQYQDQDLEQNYDLEDGTIFTIVNEEHTYAYISIFDEEEMQDDDCYLTFKKYEELIEMLKR